MRTVEQNLPSALVAFINDSPIKHRTKENFMIAINVISASRAGCFDLTERLLIARTF